MLTISWVYRATLASSIAALLAFGLGGCATTWNSIPITPRVALTPTKGDVTTQARPGAPIGGVVPVDVSIANGTDEPYLVEPDQIFAINEQGQVAQWLYWQMANQGPKMGEQGHFRRASQDPKRGDQAYALLRFDNEVHRIYGVMNLGLHKKRYLAAGQYTIADMICYPWATTWQNRNIDLNEFPNVKGWLDEIGERPAVKKAMAAGPVSRRHGRRRGESALQLNYAVLPS